MFRFELSSVSLFLATDCQSPGTIRVIPCRPTSMAYARLPGVPIAFLLIAQHISQKKTSLTAFPVCPRKDFGFLGPLSPSIQKLHPAAMIQPVFSRRSRLIACSGTLSRSSLYTGNQPTGIHADGLDLSSSCKWSNDTAIMNIIKINQIIVIINIIEMIQLIHIEIIRLSCRTRTALTIDGMMAHVLARKRCIGVEDNQNRRAVNIH